MYAQNATGENRFEYLRQARNRFIDACSLEKNENLILSYMGLAICQKLLGDSSNAILSLNRVQTVNYDYSNIDFEHDKECLHYLSHAIFIYKDIMVDKICDQIMGTGRNFNLSEHNELTASEKRFVELFLPDMPYSTIAGMQDAFRDAYITIRQEQIDALKQEVNLKLLT